MNFHARWCLVAAAISAALVGRARAAGSYAGLSCRACGFSHINWRYYHAYGGCYVLDLDG